MQKLLLVFLTTFCGCSVFQPSFTPESRQILDGKASYVISGDTFYFSFDRGKFKTRLFGIDAPALKEPMGRESFEFLRQAVHQKNVRIEFLNTDSEGRWIVNANLPSDGKIQEHIVENGFARATDPEFKNAEEQARSKKLGIWSLKNSLNH